MKYRAFRKQCPHCSETLRFRKIFSRATEFNPQKQFPGFKYSPSVKNALQNNTRVQKKIEFKCCSMGSRLLHRYIISYCNISYHIVSISMIPSPVSRISHNVPVIFCLNNFLSKKILGVKKFFGQKNFFWSKKFVGRK